MLALLLRRLFHRFPADSGDQPRVRLRPPAGCLSWARAPKRGRHRAARRTFLGTLVGLGRRLAGEGSGHGFVWVALVLLSCALAAVVWTTGPSSLLLPETGRAFSPAPPASSASAFPRLDGEPCDLLVGPARDYCHVRTDRPRRPGGSRDAAAARLPIVILGVCALVAGVGALVVVRRQR